MNPETSAPAQTIVRALLDALDRHKDLGRVALVGEDGEVVDYAGLALRVRTSARAARAAGIGVGDPVGLVMTKSVDAVATFLGLIVAGACPGFVDPRLEPGAVAPMVDAVAMRHLVVGDVSRASALGKATPAQVLAAVDLDGDDPSLAVDVDRQADQVCADDAAMILFTSGSSGAPKGVVLTQRNVMTNARGVIEHTALTAEDRLLHLMPLHHTNGLNNQVIAPLLAGACVVLHERFRPEEAVAALRDDAPTYVTGVPTMYLRMAPHVRSEDRFGSLRFLRCGSAPLTLEQQDRLEDTFGVPVLLSYGMSEATCTSTMNPPGAPRRGSVGTALRGQEVRVVRPGTLEGVAPCDEGEIVIGGAAVMRGYVGADVVDPIEDGWLHTGDLGVLDGDGYLSITGRLKDTIIRGGENISPGTIEQVLTTHPAVEDCCVVGGPHPDLGEVPVAFVTTIRGGGRADADADDLAHWVEARLSRTYVPAQFHVLDALPQNTVGKVDRSSLTRAARSDGA